MTAPTKWWTADHVRIAALKAMAGNLASAISGDPGAPSTLPTTPTSYAGPLSALPVDGGFHYRAPFGNEDPHALPYIQIDDVDVTADVFDDFAGTYLDVTITVRAAVGHEGNVTTPAIANTETEMAALSLARAAVVAIGDNIGPVARALDSQTALGIGNVGPTLAGPTIDRAQGSADRAEATAEITIRQRQYRPPSP